MRILRHSARTATALALASLLSACAKPPAVTAPAVPPITIVAPPTAKPAVKAAMTITVSPDANPDRTGRPSPVVVRVYQLRSDGGFNKATYDDLFMKEDSGLGAEMITRDEYTLTPKESRTIEVALSEETRFVGAAAGFRDLLNAQWRVIVPAPKKGLTVGVERARLVLSALP